MNYEDQVAALFANANPVPSLDLLDAVEPLDMERLALSARSSVMTDVKTEETKPEGPGRRARIALAVAMGVIAVVAIGLLVNNDNEVVSPNTTVSVTTTATPPTALADALNLFEAGTYSAKPFAEEATICQASQSGCIDPVGAESITFTFSLPDNRNWSKLGEFIWHRENRPPEGAALVFNLGGWLHSDPCRTPDEGFADVPVGPTVDDFASALAEHPLLEVTTPVDVTLGGYSGKYLDLQVPADITECDAYRAWEFWMYAQGPSHRWHLWILDVDGVRVVVESQDYESTPAEVQAELQGIVDSIQIEP